MPKKLKPSDKKKTGLPLDADDDDVSLDLEGDAEALLEEALQPDGKPKKLSLLLPKDLEDFIDKDDDDERELQKQKEREQLEQKQKEKAAQARNDKELLKQQTNAFGVLSNLSAAELEDHYLKCIQMCNQNKVNVKNAFKLQLIDYMKLIFAKQSKKTENLALMGYTLDASAKIYSYRVDKVYADMMKVMSGKVFKEVDNNDDDDAESKGDDGDGGEDEGGTPAKKRKKNYLEDVGDSNLEKMLCSEQELQKTHTDGDGLFKERTTLPSHLEFFTECPPTDPKGLLRLNSLLFDPEEAEEDSPACVAIERMPEGEQRALDASCWLPGYNGIHKCYCLMGEMDEPVVQNKALIYDSTAEEVLEHCRNYYNDDDDDMNVDGVEPEQAVDYDDGFSDDELPAPVSSLASMNSTKNKTNFSIKGMSSMVAISDNEFTFFDTSKLNFWAGPSHWSIKPTKKKTVINPGDVAPQKGAKKNVTIDFGRIDSDKMKKVFGVSTVGLSKRTLRAWSKEKNRFVNISYTSKKLLSLFHNENLLYVNKSFTSHGIFEAAKSKLLDDAGDHLTPEAYVCRDDDDPEVNMLDDHHEDADDPPPGSPLPGDPDPGDLSSGLELLPAPPKVEKIAITFSKTQRKVDMKRLKTAIWEYMDLEASVKENISSRINTPPPTSRLKRKGTGPVTFSEVLAALPKLLPRDDAAQLSTGVVFMAVLHMANEKTLQLDQGPNYKDFTIGLDC